MWSMEQFKNPGPEYRGMPFWAWNTKMNREHIDHILEELKEMGMGGAYFHCRTGMDMPYLGKEFMELIRYAHEKAGEKGLITGLYDEDRWPSGFAGGLITKEDKNRGRFLLFSPEELPEEEEVDEIGEDGTADASAVSSGRRRFLAAFGVQLDQKGYLKDYVRVSCKEPAPEGYDKWYAYLEVYGNNPWYNNQAYVNTLDPNAIRDFIDVTYEAYKKELGDSFGKDIKAIFTDEPQFGLKTQFDFAHDKTRQMLSFTDDLDETYQKAYGESILDHLPELFWELPDGEISVHRYHYHDHVADRFAQAYADQIGAWCKENNIPLTGHMMREPSLGGQTMALGEAMRSYRSFGVPGIDMLSDHREITTAKQAQSAVHQFGRKDMLSELYGVTNWDFDFRGHKSQGDWQAALGVTWRVHHLTWTVMEGEAKRDYPASIGYQSPWYKEYSYIENYFARINTAMHQGDPKVRIGVIHPIESYWLYWGDREHTEGICSQMEENFQNVTKWLLGGLLDFDFISESLLADWEQQGEEGFTAGKMRYDVILVPDCVTLRSSTVKRLREFAGRGGQIVFAGKVPGYQDALKTEEIKEFASGCIQVPFQRESILTALQEYRELDIRNEQGIRTDKMLYQMRTEEKDGTRWLFVAHSEKPVNKELAECEHFRFEVNGNYQVFKLLPLTGEIEEKQVAFCNGKTRWEEESYDYDSFLYQLKLAEEGKTVQVGTAAFGKPSRKTEIPLPETVRLTMEEPNVFLLDQAEYSFDGGAFQPKEEILRIDNRFRRQLGYPLRSDAYAQPWTREKEDVISHSLELRFVIESEWETDRMKLALEEADKTEIYWDEEKVPGETDGYYVDRSIRTVSMPKLTRGTHILRVKIPYYEHVNVEAMYLLGDFGVRIQGRSARLIAPVREIAFGDISSQGLAFYGGNLTYGMEIQVPEDREVWVEASRFRCSLIKVKLDGEEKGIIAFSPYRLSLGRIKAGAHYLELTAFGNRFNTFGALHNCNETETWIGPNYWRSKGTQWAYEYQTRATGILKAPVLWSYDERPE